MGNAVKTHFLIPLTRSPAVVWLIATGFVLPKNYCSSNFTNHRRAVNESFPRTILKNRTDKWPLVTRLLGKPLSGVVT